MIVKATEIINNYGVDQLSFKQLTIGTDTRPSEMIATFLNLNGLVIDCIAEAVSVLSVFSTEFISGQSKQGFLYLWHLLAEFNYRYLSEATLIAVFLRSPSHFPTCDAKHELVKVFDSNLRISFNDRAMNNEGIRFSVFAYLLQSANKYSRQLAQDNHYLDRQKSAEVYFCNQISRNIDSMLALPIC